MYLFVLFSPIRNSLFSKTPVMPKLESYKYFFISHYTHFSPVVIMITENASKFLHIFLPYLSYGIRSYNHYVLYFLLYVSPLVLVLKVAIFLMFTITLCQILFYLLDGLNLVL